MAYLILADRQGEFDRRELRQAVVIGRALDCDICVRDILLSRKHCRVEPYQDRWVIEDLGSKNGTRVGSEAITRHILSDGDVLRIGKTQVSFHAGAFVPAPTNQPRRRENRAADPKEALSGTVLGFQLFDMEEDARVSGFPIPKPKPPEPVSLGNEAVTGMVAQMASTSWDIALSDEKRPTKTTSKPPQEVLKRVRQIQKAKAAPPKTEPQPIEESAPVIRSRSPDERATVSGWVAGFYILLALTLGISSIAVIVLRSNPTLQPLNWLAR